MTHYLPGDLVLGSQAQESPDTFREAGELLAMLHAQSEVLDPDYESNQNAKVLRNLDKPHRIRPDVATRLRETVASWPRSWVMCVK